MHTTVWAFQSWYAQHLEPFQAERENNLGLSRLNHTATWAFDRLTYLEALHHRLFQQFEVCSVLVLFHNSTCASQAGVCQTLCCGLHTWGQKIFHSSPGCAHSQAAPRSCAESSGWPVCQPLPNLHWDGHLPVAPACCATHSYRMVWDSRSPEKKLVGKVPAFSAIFTFLQFFWALCVEESATSSLPSALGFRSKPSAVLRHFQSISRSTSLHCEHGVHKSDKASGCDLGTASLVAKRFHKRKIRMITFQKCHHKPQDE